MSFDQLWEQSLLKRKKELGDTVKLLQRKRKRKTGFGHSVAVVTLDEAIQHNSFGSFQFAIQNLSNEFAERKVSTLLSKYIYPSLDHVRVFSQGISAATNSDPTASLVWGCLYIVIQCACLFAESLEDIISQLASLEGLLPYFEKDVSLYADNKAVKFGMHTILVDYIDFCITIIRHITKSPIVLFVRNIYSSSLRNDLKKVKERLKKDIDDFDRAVNITERSRAINADDIIMQSQSQLIALSPLRQASYPVNVSDPGQIQFPVDTVSMGENPNFSGREVELTNIYKLIVQNHTENKPCSVVLHGFGGIGKTETALKFTYKYRYSFDGVFWISADPEQETEILRTFGNIGRRLALFQSDSILDPQVEMVLEWLETTDRRWLVVFDNVLDWRSVRRYWPTKSQSPSAIIVTSQKGAPWADHHMDLEPFGDKEGSEFLLLQMHIPQLPPADPVRVITEAISHELGGSPLYLSHAHGFMTLTKCPPEEYLSIIRTRSNTFGYESEGTWRYGRAASTTHDKLLQSLTPGATDLLFMLAFMSPDDVAEDLLLIDHVFTELEFLSDKVTYLSYIAELNIGRLVTRDTSSSHPRLRMHRATQEAMLSKLNNNLQQREKSFNQVIRLVRENYPDPSSRAKLHIAEAHVWPLITKVLPHVLSSFNCFERAWPSMSGDMFLAQLLADIASMDLYDRGRIAETYKINKMILKILKSLHAPTETRLMGDVLAILGLCTDFMALSKRQEGLELRHQMVKVREGHFASIAEDKVTLDDRIWLHNAYTDLVCSQQQINDFDGARRNLEKCYVQYKVWGDENAIPYEYSKYFNQMAYVLLYENESEKAVEYSKRGYELVEQATPGAQIAILYKFDYANILYQQGDAAAALKMLKDLLKQCKHDCGKDNVRTLEVRINIGIVSYFLRNWDIAEKQLRKVLLMNGRELWPEENIIRAKFYLSQVLKAVNPDNKEALEMEKEAETGLEEILKLDSPGQAEEYRDNLPLLYDYLVHWECRLVTPRRKK